MLDYFIKLLNLNSFFMQFTTLNVLVFMIDGQVHPVLGPIYLILLC